MYILYLLKTLIYFYSRRGARHHVPALWFGWRFRAPTFSAWCHLGRSLERMRPPSVNCDAKCEFEANQDDHYPEGDDERAEVHQHSIENTSRENVRRNGTLLQSSEETWDGSHDHRCRCEWNKSNNLMNFIRLRQVDVIAANLSIKSPVHARTQTIEFRHEGVLHDVHEHFGTDHQSDIIEKFSRQSCLYTARGRDPLCSDEHETNTQVNSFNDIESAHAEQFLRILLLEHVSLHLSEVIRDEN